MITTATDNRKYRYGPQTGNNCIFGTPTDSVEIPTEFGNFDDDELGKRLPKWLWQRPLPKIARLAPKTSILPFSVVGLCRDSRGQFLRTGRGRKPQICHLNCHPICHSSRDISISGLGATLPFPVVGHCRNHLATLYSGSPWSKIPDLLLEFRRYLL